MNLTEREFDVVTNIWGDEVPRNLQRIDTEQLVQMHDRVSSAVQASYVDNDVEALSILLPLEEKIVRELHSRI